MRKLSDLIKESEGSKTYKALVTVKIEVTVVASSEGDAGYKIDAEVEKIPGFISHDIEEIEETQDKAINQDLSFDENDAPKTPYGTEHLEEQGASIGNYVMSTDDLMRDEIYCIVDLGLNEWNGGYKFVGTSTESLNQIVYTFEDTLGSPAQESPEIFEFTEDEMQEMIDLKQIAFDGNKSESKVHENATPGTKVTVVDDAAGEYEVEITEVVDTNTFAAKIVNVISGFKKVGDVVKVSNNVDTGGKTVFGVIEETKIASVTESTEESDDCYDIQINENSPNGRQAAFVVTADDFIKVEAAAKAPGFEVYSVDVNDVILPGQDDAKPVSDRKEVQDFIASLNPLCILDDSIEEKKTNTEPSVPELYTSFIQINKDAIANGEDAVELTDTTFYADQIYNIYFEDAVLVDKTISEADAEAKAKELAEEMSKYAVEQGTIL